MRLGQIGYGRQNPPIQITASSRIDIAKGMLLTSLQDWKAVTAPLLPQKRRWYDVSGFSNRQQIGAQRTQVFLKLMIIRVNLLFLYRRQNQYKRKLSEWDIYLYKHIHKY
ncbi:Hypothetical_protein [Hexamita inflata]|uniref:Hypothetical_protein n=1 Tax=Hexamita inflata TaxID=28002 RepID=A0AA86QVL2_9EUKA|nr:Hypothetical protein HINF_LOCUS49252 [Hexamita inflata]